MSMNDKSRHVSVPQPLPANFGPPVPPVGPGPGQGPIVGQQPWMPNNAHPLPYHLPGQGYPSTYKNNTIHTPEFPPGMHPAGYMPRYPSYDTQCQSFPFGKIHEGPGRPPNPNAYPIIRHYNSQHYNENAKEPINKNSLDLFPQSKSPGQAKEKNNGEKNGNGREDMSSPSDGKSDSETNHTTTESCPDDTRSPTSLDKHDNNFFGGDKSENSMKSISDSNSHLESEHKKIKNNNHNNIDSNSEQDSQTFSSIASSNNAKKEVLHSPYEMRIHRQFNPHGDGMYSMFPDDDRRQNNHTMGHHINEPMHFGYRGAGRDMDKIGDMDANNSSENVFQVPSISSTTPPKIFPPIPPSPISEPWEDAKYYQQQEDDSEKLPRKKRKRCGECPGCLQKQNCGRCGPCRSVRSHQICKMRKCESLKTKKEKAAEDALKGRKGKELLNASVERSASENSVKMNGNPQSYFSQTDSLSPTNSNSMHVGSQGVRSHIDQYQPQGGSDFQPQGMLNSYNSNSQYGSYSPQVPLPHNPLIQPMFENRVPMQTIDGPVDMDNHRMTNHRLKSLIHNRQNQREHGQLIPISNPIHDSSFNSSSSLSPVNHYAPAYPNHQESLMRSNSMPYSVPPDTSTTSLMHLQQLSPNSISPQKSWTESSRKTPESSPTVLPVQNSPLKTSAVQNGLADPPPSEEPSIMVNGNEKSEKINNGALDVNSDSVGMDVPIKKENDKNEAKVPPSVQELKAPTPDPTVGRVGIPMQPPPTSPRFNSSFTPPSYAYRPHQTLTPIQHGCMPPPLPMPTTNGGTNHNLPPTDANCDEPTQSPPFLLNTTTSMNTYINITNTYNNSKLSFSNATCLPTYTVTSVSNSSQTYSGSPHFYNSQQVMHFNNYNLEGNMNYQQLPKGGGISKSYIDSGRIQSLDSFPRSDIPYTYGHCEALPLHPNYYSSSFPPTNTPINYPPFSNSNCSTPVCVESQDVDPMERIEKLRTNTKLEPPQCDCMKNKEVMSSEKLPYYTHLGSGSSVSAIRELMECRSGEKGNAIRIEKLLYSGKEGKTSQGCPLAKWIIRRSGPEEKLLTVIRHRPGHSCPTAYIIIAMVAWEGVSEDIADMLYKTVVYKTVNFGIPTQRKCGTNEMRTCACQGLDPEICGASFSFGCSWSMYYNGCKFARSKNARKFKLTEKDEEKELEDRLQTLATDVAHLYKRMAPESFYNQTEFEQQASDCRLGTKKGRPFSGVTACVDYCAHSHKDLQNMNNGCTVVVTLNKHKGWEKPEDEQLHVLPLYVVDSTDEYGSKEGQDKKITSRALEVLEKYPIDYRIRTTPLKPCKTRGRKPKDGYSPRKQALQAAFKQLIASGKLRRIDPLDLYPKCNNKLPLVNNLQPDHNFNSHNILQNNDNNYNMQSFKGGETVCKFYAGKPITHYANDMQNQSSQSWLPTSQSVNNSYNNSTSMSDKPLLNSSVASYDSRSFQVSSSGHSFTNTCSKIASGTDVTTSCNNTVSYSNDRNNNHILCVASQTSLSPPPSYQTSLNSPNYPHFYNSNFLPHTFRHPHPYNSYQTSHNYYENHPMYHSRYPYGYSEPKVALKIPGNYSASNNYPYNRENYQNVSYSSNSLGTLNNFCNYTMQNTPHHNVPESFIRSDPENNTHFNVGHVTKNLSSQSQSNISNQSIFVKSEEPTFNETQNNVQSDSTYALHDLDSKSVSCFPNTSKQPLPPVNSIKEEKPSTNTSTVSNTKYYTDDSTVKYCSDDYNGNAKNYNYHLQQSNLGLPYSCPPNYNTGISTNNTDYAFKEGYEHGVNQKGMPNNNNELTNLSKMTEGPWAGKNKYPETNHLGILASKYSLSIVEEDENFIDSTTLEGDEVYEGHSDNESSFKDPEVGGVAIALTHGSVLFECAKHEMHGSTALKKPDRRNPTRISLVFYQHKHLNFESHGEAEWDLKMKEKRVSNMKNVDVCFDVSPNKKPCFQNDIPNVNDVNMTANSNWMTVFSMPPLAIGAPFRP